MDALTMARLLCEAVENEDAKEVEHLLKNGADPNLVLPTGIAAIHLAAGKENESALRCLTLILQQGGDPNVRSMELLTPVHVAASWGCHKALVFLLRKGGDPTLEDQEGNTASDLALMEGNRRCVVALQEYVESPRMEENRDVNSPYSSTRISPFSPMCKKENLTQNMNNAAVTSQMLPLGRDEKNSSDGEQSLGMTIRTSQTNQESTEHLSFCMQTIHNDFCGGDLTDSDVLCSTKLSQTSHCIADTSANLCTDVIDTDNLPHEAQKENNNLSMNSQTMCNETNQSQNVNITQNKMKKGICSHSSESPTKRLLKSVEEIILDFSTSSQLIDSNYFARRVKGLDVTSPDHVYIYSKSKITYDDSLEKTHILDSNDSDNTKEHNVSSTSSYNSCESECYASLGESPSSSEKKSRLKSDSGCSTSLKNCTNAYHLKNSEEKACSQAQICQISVLGTVQTYLSEESKLNDNGSLGQHQNHVHYLQCPRERDSELPCNSQSATLCVDYEHNNINFNQSLKGQPRHLMSYTRNIKMDVPANNKAQIHLHDPDPHSVNNQIKLTGEEQHQVLERQLEDIMGLTRHQESPSNFIGTSDTLTVEPAAHDIHDESNADLDHIFNKQLKDMMILTKQQITPFNCTPTCETQIQVYHSDTLPVANRTKLTGKEDKLLDRQLKDMLFLTKQKVSSSNFTASPDTLLLEPGAEDVHNKSYTDSNQEFNKQLKDMMVLTKQPISNYNFTPAPKTQTEGYDSDTLPVINPTKQTVKEDFLTKQQVSSSHYIATPDTLSAESTAEDVQDNNSALNTELRKMMMLTKTSQANSDQEKSFCHFTPRTKSRLLSSNSRSSSSLFDETVEMPQRGRRIRSPDTQKSPCMSGISGSRRSLFHSSMTCDPAENSGTCTNGQEIQKTADARNVTVSNFLTDDLTSSDTDRSKSDAHWHQKCGSRGVDCLVSGTTWLTEDGADESSSDTAYVYNNGSLEQRNEAWFDRSLQQSTCSNDLVAKDTPATKASRYSFSRLSCVLKSDDGTLNSCHLETVNESGTQDVPLSPGGRPLNESTAEPVEYLYTDCERGHSLIERHVPCIDDSAAKISEDSDDTIIYDWREHKSNKQKAIQAPSNKVAVELYRLSNNDIAARLKELGEETGPVTSQTRKLYIALLDKRLKESLVRGSTGITGYSRELSLALRTFQIPDSNTDECTLSKEFDKPDKSQKWREGVLKSSFNYLLLDPRVTRNLPARCHTLSKLDCFRTFISSIFYVGKGKRSRPYFHLYEALTHHKSNNKKPCDKVQHILDIWNSGLGVISLHCFQNTIPVEAYTREACMVDAIGLKMLTNQKKGVYYGQLQSWSPTRRQLLGVHMLHRAMKIFLAEGERQLRPPDIRSGS
ncbi:uncharacterized protein LOC108712891 isoform X2 [Xenopus laevis]|uniref:Uncharacterized protein LOC108712891 isoform X2 n=1 Tax=Xenopus laevis TaxID=8355 RepID=A0A8J0UQ23_XENLA|nr:uncharacterized protein LOC108712891 isoform X2 [Xenopus laevis]